MPPTLTALIALQLVQQHDNVPPPPQQVVVGIQEEQKAGGLPGLPIVRTDPPCKIKRKMIEKMTQIRLKIVEK